MSTLVLNPVLSADPLWSALINARARCAQRLLVHGSARSLVIACRHWYLPYFPESFLLNRGKQHGEKQELTWVQKVWRPFLHRVVFYHSQSNFPNAFLKREYASSDTEVSENCYPSVFSQDVPKCQAHSQTHGSQSQGNVDQHPEWS